MGTPTLFFNLILFTSIFIFLTIIVNITAAATLPKFSAILVFGDSTVDTGNNNFVDTIFKSNHLPYGQDFPSHIPTGRFSNGKLIPDFIANFLGIKETVPAFLHPNLSNHDILTGVCFASAGSGYDELTVATNRVISISKQLELFKIYISRLKGIVGEDEANRIINGAFIIVSAGTNDFAINYYDIPTRKHQFNFNIGGYQDFLLNIVHNFLKELYDLGCRSIGVAGLPPIGCLPIQMTARLMKPMDRKCLEDQNSDSESYNQKLQKVLNQLQASLPGSRFQYANVYEPLLDMATHPHKYGFVETTRGCCGTGLVEAANLCNEEASTCGNASQFLFWDCIHPTESAYKTLIQYLEKKIAPSLPPIPI